MRARRVLQTYYPDLDVRAKAMEAMYEHIFGKEWLAWQEIETSFFSANKPAMHNAIKTGLMNVVKGKSTYTEKTEVLDEIINTRQFNIELKKVTVGGYRGPAITCEFVLTDDAGHKFNQMLTIDDDTISVNTNELISVFKNHFHLYISQIVSYFGKKTRTWNGIRCISAFTSRYDKRKYLDYIKLLICMEHYNGQFNKEPITKTMTKTYMGELMTVKAPQYNKVNGYNSTDALEQEIQGLDKDEFNTTWSSEQAYECYKFKDANDKDYMTWVLRGYINAVDGQFSWSNRRLEEAIENRYQRMMDWYQNTKGSWKLSLFNLEAARLQFTSEDSQGVNISINEPHSSYGNNYDSALIRMLTRTGLIKDLYKEFAKYLTDAMICNLSELLLDGTSNHDNATIPLRAFLDGIRDANV